MILTDHRKIATKTAYNQIHNLYIYDFEKDYNNFQFYDNLIEILKSNPNTQLPIVDLGSGAGTVIDYLLSNKIKKPIIAVEISDKFCKYLNNKYQNDQIKVQQIDMFDFVNYQKDDSIGAYTANFSIIHIPDEQLDKFFAQIYKTLQTDGLFLLSAHKGTFKGMEQDPYQTQKDPRLQTNQKIESNMNYFTKRELEDRLTKSKLSILESEEVIFKTQTGDLPTNKIWIITKK